MTDGRPSDSPTKLMLRLSGGTSITFIDDRPMIFSQRGHALYEVNRIAGYIGCRLEEGVQFEQLAQEIVERGIDRPEPMLRGVLADWSHAGLVEACDALPCSRDSIVQTISIAGIRLRLRYHDQVLAAGVAPLFVHLEDDAGACDVSYDLWSADGLVLLSRNGGPASVLHAAQAATVVKARVAEEVVNDPRQLIALHAGCLARNGRALLLTGRPGAGKTVLTSFLLQAGFAYGGDDITMLAPDGKVRGLRFLPAIKSGAWRLLAPIYPDLARLPIHLRPDGRRVRYPTPPVMAGETPMKVGWILKLRREKAGKARITRLPPTLVMKHLLSEAASNTREISRHSLDVLVRTIAAARSYEICYADLADAARLVRKICADEPA